MFRKTYTREFKIRAVQLMGESSKPIRQLAEELGVSENNLYNWRKQLREKADKAFSNQPRLDEKELEIRRLKARVSELEEGREILKKPPRFSQKRKASDLRDDKAAIGFPQCSSVMSSLRPLTGQLLSLVETSCWQTQARRPGVA